jgi:phosphate transport system substrate-binding protein
MASAYKCPNVGNCDKADQQHIIQLSVGSETNCPECGSTLIPAGVKPSSPTWLPLALIIFLLALIGVGVWIWSHQLVECVLPEVRDEASNTCKIPQVICKPGEVLEPSSQTCAKPIPPPRQVETLLRFHGSNTIGGKLLPALAEAFMNQEGFTNIHKVPGVKEEENFIVGEQGGAEKQIEIHAHGTKTAFEDLKTGLCDIGMASQKISQEDRDKLLPLLGDLTSNASEHVLALDGIAIIIHPSNPVRTLTLSQLADIFSGVITDWSQVGGRAGTIAVYARDDKSGTYGFFKDSVLKTHNKTLIANAQRFEDSRKLSESVGSDSAGIGFIGLNYVGSNKVVGLADNGVEALKPNLRTIKTEDYMLSRRLYLYTAERPSNRYVFKFIEFALGPSAYPVIDKSGQVSPDPTPVPKTQDEKTDDPRNKSARWHSLTANTTDEIPTRFRFRFGSSELDTRAYRDIGRVAAVHDRNYHGRPVILIGFADGKGSHSRNCKLSEERANLVKRELELEGLNISQVVGLCEEAPVASNDTEEGREKNRRVEVWVK